MQTQKTLLELKIIKMGLDLEKQEKMQDLKLI